MASQLKGIKPRELTEDETFHSYDKWQSLLEYCLRKEVSWARFLDPESNDSKCQKLTPDNQTRGFEDDAQAKRDGKKFTKTVKASNLQSNFLIHCPIHPSFPSS